MGISKWIIDKQIVDVVYVLYRTLQRKIVRERRESELLWYPCHLHQSFAIGIYTHLFSDLQP